MSEKEFKEGHRRDLSRSRVFNAKQRESRAKHTFPMGGRSKLKKELCTAGPKTPNLYWDLQTWGS
jgi:hypothetical protein